VTVGGVNNAVAKAAKVLDNDLSGDKGLTVAVGCSVWQCVQTACCSEVQCMVSVLLCGSVLQCVAVWCSVLHCVGDQSARQ